jgi:hypothetical protein
MTLLSSLIRRETSLEPGVPDAAGAAAPAGGLRPWIGSPWSSRGMAASESSDESVADPVADALWSIESEYTSVSPRTHSRTAPSPKPPRPGQPELTDRQTAPRGGMRPDKLGDERAVGITATNRPSTSNLRGPVPPFSRDEDREPYEVELPRPSHAEDTLDRVEQRRGFTVARPPMLAPLPDPVSSVEPVKPASLAVAPPRPPDRTDRPPMVREAWEGETRVIAASGLSPVTQEAFSHSKPLVPGEPVGAVAAALISPTFPRGEEGRVTEELPHPIGLRARREESEAVSHGADLGSGVSRGAAPNPSSSLRPRDVELGPQEALTPRPGPVQVSIGRVEVNAVAETRRERVRRPAPPPSRFEGLSDYLARRARGRG